MSSTSQEILEAQKLAEEIKKGNHPAPQSVQSGNPAAEQLTKDVPKGFDIPEDATVGGMKAESAKVVDEKESAKPVEAREIAKVVGESGEHSLKEHFVDPTIAAEEKTAVAVDNMTPAEKQTQLTDTQEDAEQLHSKVKAGTAVDDDDLPAAKQTKLTDEQKNGPTAKAEKKVDEDGDVTVVEEKEEKKETKKEEK